MLGWLPSQMHLFKNVLFMDICIDFIHDWEVDQKACEQGQSKILFSNFQNISNYFSASIHQ